MQAQKPCEQFGTDRSREIDDLIEAACGRPCPGRRGGPCALAPVGPAAEGEDTIRRLRAVV